MFESELGDFVDLCVRQESAERETTPAGPSKKEDQLISKIDKLFSKICALENSVDSLLTHEHENVRYWAAIGCLERKILEESATKELENIAETSLHEFRGAKAGVALIYFGKRILKDD